MFTGVHSDFRETANQVPNRYHLVSTRDPDEVNFVQAAKTAGMPRLRLEL